MLVAAIALASIASSASVDAALDAETIASQRWYFGWSAAFAAGYSGAAIVAWKTHDAGLREDARVGAFMSGLGFLSTVLAPPPALFADPSLDAEGRAKRLESAADFDALAHAWFTHAGGIGANAIAGGYLWFHAHRPWRGLLQFATGSLVSELKIFTAPNVARSFVRGASIAPWVATDGGGLSLQAAFDPYP